MKKMTDSFTEGVSTQGAKGISSEALVPLPEENQIKCAANSPHAD